MAPRRLALWGLVSTCLAIATVVHAFRKRPNFYAAAVYLAKSNACMLILWNQGIFQTVLLGKALQAVFLGELRLIEIERLQERGWFAVTETLLALTIFKNDFESTFVLLFVGLLFLKVFHWLASDRIEMMEQAAQVSRLAHARMLGLLSLLWLADIGCLLFAVESIMIDGPTVMIMFASEYLILLANVWTLSAKYVINCIDMRTEAPWEEKSIYVFYVELAADFFKLCTYLTFFGLILTFYGLPLNILRDVYITLRSFILKVRDLRRYRQATRNMDELYPNATREEMDGMADKTCIICREDMEWRAARGEHDAGAGGAEGAGPAEPQAPGPAAPRTGPNDTPKKLPCGHVFHFHCLRSWLERQQSCPTCRRPVLPNEQPQAVPLAAAGARAGNGGPPGPAVPGANGAGPTTPAPAGAVEAENAAIRQAQVNLARNLGREAFTSLFPGIPFPPEAEDVQPAVRTPRIASLEGTDVDPAQIDARPTPTQPPISSSGPIASTSGAATAAAADADNPLARFSLPSLPVPAGGEASLYQAPPTFSYPTIGTPASSFADLAYGAYPRFNGPRPTAFGATPSRTSPPNLIERIESVRTRWETRNNGQPDAAVGGDASGLSGSAPNVPTATAVPDEPSETRPPTTEEKGKGKAIENVEDVEASSTETVSPREAALRAAERRLGTGVTGSSTATKDAVDSDDLDSRMPEAKGKAWDPDDVAASAPPPRLIPLFDPSDPASVSAAALRCSSDEAQTAVWSHVDLEGAVSEAMQGKMRQLASFQARIDRLIEEMRVTLGGNP